jgi:Domain of unknown function (DUF3859)
MFQRIGLLCCGAILCSCQSSSTITGATLVQYGLYRNDTIAYRQGPETSEGRFAVIGDTTLLKRTNTVHAKVNTTFGIEYTVTGAPANADVDVVLEVIHPPIKNPYTGKTVDVERGTYHVLIDVPYYNDIRLDEAWNVVPGRWTLRVLYQSRVLLEKTFHVVVDTPNGSNQSPDPTAGRSDTSLHFMKTSPLQDTLAPASGGSALSR